VIVPGHAIPRDLDRLDENEGWFLKPFQSGEGPCFLEHIRSGVELAAHDPESLLIFSGGATDARAGEETEGRGYRLVALRRFWFGHPEMQKRVGVEEFARDSFENLLFSICRFHRLTGQYPGRVTVVGWAFKKDRFEFHRQAIRYPESAFGYVGVNDPPDRDGALSGELSTLAQFHADPYGCGPELAAKRAARNPFGDEAKYDRRCPDLAGLILHCGPELYRGPLPW
jgi:hypothetical protein